MQCHEFIETAGQWMEGEPTAESRSHVDGCAQCRGLIADLTAIRTTAGQLEAEAEPPAHLWNAIRTQLEAEGIIREPALSWKGRLAEFFQPTPRLALAGAYLMLVLVAATMFSLNSTQDAQQELYVKATIDRLRTIAPPAEGVVTQVAEESPLVAASYRDSLKTIDTFILECEKVVRQEPRNDLAREYLVEAHQRRAELLTAMVERGAYGEGK